MYKRQIGNIRKTAFDGLLLIVSNPVDILTEVALRESGYPEERVIGSGTVLDTARLKYLISEELEIDSRNVHAFIVGEHGDSELAVWSCANIYGIPVEKFAELRRQKGFSEEMKEIYCSVRDSAYEIIKRKGATYYGIGMAAAKIAEALVRDSHTVAPVSVHLNGEYGLQDLCLSIPTVLGKNGAEQILEINFNEEEKRKLWHSAEELKKIGVQDVRIDDKCYVYGIIPATEGLEDKPAIGFIAHMDTVSDYCDHDIKPMITEKYDGEALALGESGVTLSPEMFPHLKNLKGRTLITSDGTTILGADDKAGIAEILTLLSLIHI